MSEKFNSQPEVAPPAPNPAEIKRRLADLNVLLEKYNAFVSGMSGSDEDKTQADKMLAAIQKEKAALKEALNPDPFEIELRERIAQEGSYHFVSQFTEKGTAVAYLKERDELKYCDAVIVTRSGTIVHDGIEVRGDYSGGFVIARATFGVPSAALSQRPVFYIDELGNRLVTDHLIYSSSKVTNGMARVSSSTNLSGADFEIMQVRSPNVRYAYGSECAAERTNDGLYIVTTGHESHFLHTALGKRHGPFTEITKPEPGSSHYICTEYSSMLKKKVSTLIHTNGNHSDAYEYVGALLDGIRVVQDRNQYFIFEESPFQKIGPYVYAENLGAGLAAVNLSKDSPFEIIDVHEKKKNKLGKFTSIRECSGGLIWVERSVSVFGLSTGRTEWVPIDTSGVVRKDYWNYVVPGPDGVARVVKGDGMQYFIDTRNDNEEYRAPAHRDFKTGLAVLGFQGEFKIQNKRGDTFGPFDQVEYVEDGIYAGYSTKGTHIITPDKENIIKWSTIQKVNDVYVVRELTGGGACWLCTKGQLLVKDLPECLAGPFRDCMYFNQDFVSAHNYKGHWFLYAVASRAVLGPYQNVVDGFNSNEGVARVTTLDGREIYINMRGEEVFKPN